MKVNKSSTMSASPATLGYMNGRHKSFFLKKDISCSYINQNIPQLFSTRRPTKLLRSTRGGSSSARAASTAHIPGKKIGTHMANFYEWLAGFTDGEGYFYIVTTGQSCAFRFQINLHKDDINVLYYIHKTLGFGEVRSYRNFASFTVTRIKDIALLIEGFSQYPLQGSKWLNYRDFSKAFELYLNSCAGQRGRAPSETLEAIKKLKNGMNRSRTDYTMPFCREINITPYWLLGFIEGEGCFSINKGNSYRLDFSLSQSYTNHQLLQKIRTFLDNLPSEGSTYGNSEGALGIYSVRSNNPNHQPTTRIETARIPYITNVFIPFLESLTWRSKKQLDFQDWKNILLLKQQGHHLSERGVKLIDLILSQMNNHRLSTTSTHPTVDRTLLLARVNLLLSGPSNYGLRNGRKWIISLNKYYNSSRRNICVIITDESGNNLHSFDSLGDCANFLSVHPSTVSKRIINGIPFLLENKQAYIRKEAKEE